MRQKYRWTQRERKFPEKVCILKMERDTPRGKATDRETQRHEERILQKKRNSNKERQTWRWEPVKKGIKM